jgi:hypothetical protein
VAKKCPVCGREKGPPEHGLGGVCNMARLSNGHLVHATRIDPGGDLHDKLGDDLKVIDRWIKRGQLNG